MKRTLQKVLDELKKDKPDISYVRGMLEVLVEDETIVTAPSFPSSASITSPSAVMPVLATVKLDGDAGVLDSMAHASIERVKAISAVSAEVQ